MGKRGTDGHETSCCPCDKCIHKTSCKKNCDSFDKYLTAYSPGSRERILSEFIKMQNLSTKHFRVSKNEQRKGFKMV